MATSIATHYALEIHELRDQVHACENAFNDDLHSIIDKVEDEYLNEIDVHAEIQKQLDERLALIDQLEAIYGDLGEDSQEPVAHAAYNRRVRKRAGEISNIHNKIAKFTEKDEELKKLAASHVREKAVYNALDLANSLVDQVGFETLKILNLGHKEVSPETTNRGGQLVTRLLILHKKLIAVHHELGGFEDADPTSMYQRTDLKWQSACGGLWWCLDYLILRLATIKRALMTIEDGTTDSTVKTDLLLYPMVDIHFFKQNIAALRALHNDNQVLSALSKIASRFSPKEMNKEISAAQERTEVESTSAQTTNAEPGEEQAILDLFRDTQQVADKTLATDADELVTCRLGLYRKADAFSWKSKIPATTLVNIVMVPGRKVGTPSFPAPIDTTEEAQHDKQLFGGIEKKLNDIGNVDDSVPKVSTSAFHPGSLPDTWTLPPYSALSIKDAEGFPSPHQPVYVWAEKRDNERQKLLQVQSEAVVSGSYEDEERSGTKSHAGKDPSALLMGDDEHTKAQSGSKESRSNATVQADAGIAKNAEGLNVPRQYRVSEFNTDNVSMLSRWTDMTSASRTANDLSLPLHRVIRMDPKHLKDVLVFKASDAYINAKDRQGHTPLELAITNAAQAPDAAHDLVVAEVDVTRPCLGYSNALLAAIRRLDFNLALFIAEKVPDQVRETPID